MHTAASTASSQTDGILTAITTDAGSSKTYSENETHMTVSQTPIEQTTAESVIPVTIPALTTNLHITSDPTTDASTIKKNSTKRPGVMQFRTTSPLLKEINFDT